MMRKKISLASIIIRNNSPQKCKKNEKMIFLNEGKGKN